MKIDKFVVGSFEMNCYLVSDPVSEEAILIDPGDEADLLIHAVEDRNLLLKFIINTHCHIDHTGAVQQIKEYFKVPFYIHRSEQPLLSILPQQAQMFGLQLPQIPEVSQFIIDGQELSFGTLKGKALHTPGHSPGSLSLLFDNHLFVGDVLFYDSIGRTDLIQGDYEQLITSIKSKILTLPDDTVVHPGHGPETTIGRERQLNPFLS